MPDLNTENTDPLTDLPTTTNTTTAKNAPGRPAAIRSTVPRPNPEQIYNRISKIRHLLMTREFGQQEILTKIDILRSEFQYSHDYNPIEHVSSRVKSLESIIDKAQRKGIPLTAEDIGANILDIAGIRLTCSFVSDTYTMRDLLLAQNDLTLIRERDYIKDPKPNGYQSLHLIIEVPVFLAEGPERVPVEIQLRTVAMDFWASLEHKIHYKDDSDVPRHLTDALKLAADMSSALDASMERIHDEILDLHTKNEAAQSGEESGPSTQGSTRRIHHPLNQSQIIGDDSQDLFRAVLESFGIEPPRY